MASPIVLKNTHKSVRYCNFRSIRRGIMDNLLGVVTGYKRQSNSFAGTPGTLRSEHITLLHGGNGIGWHVQRGAEGLRAASPNGFAMDSRRFTNPYWQHHRSSLPIAP